MSTTAKNYDLNMLKILFSALIKVLACINKKIILSLLVEKILINFALRKIVLLMLMDVGGKQQELTSTLKIINININ